MKKPFLALTVLTAFLVTGSGAIPPNLFFAAQAQTTTPVGAISGDFAIGGNGEATYTIPIKVPPGTNGVAPNLSLAYNSQQGNGLVGVGWSLTGLSAIHRCPQTLATDGVVGGINFDSNDRFCVDGQRLIAVRDSTGNSLTTPTARAAAYGQNGTVYQTEKNSFTEFTSHGISGSGPLYFTAVSKDGSRAEYGNTNDSKIEKEAPNSIEVHSGLWGSWQSEVSGPLNHYACGGQVRFQEKQEEGDNTAMNSLKLKFCDFENPSNSTWQLIHEGFRGTWQPRVNGPSNYYACGGQVRFQEKQEEGDDTAMNGLRLKFCNFEDPNDYTWQSIHDGLLGNWEPEVSCPSNYYISGAEVRFDNAPPFEDQTGMNGLRLSCKSNKVRIWAINKTTDRNGNYVNAEYNDDQINGEYYPLNIKYTGNTGRTPQRMVKFDYGENRSDSTTSYIAGSVVKMTKRLNKISTYVDIDGNGNDIDASENLVKQYELSYQTGSATNRSRIESIRECSVSSNNSTCLPATTFTYNNPEQASFTGGTNVSIGGWSDANASDARRYLAMDTNGDGLTDIVEIYKKNSSQTGSTIWRNNGSGFDNSNSSSQDLGGWNDRGSSAERRYIPMDVNGDGLDDIVELYKKNENGENKTKALFWQSNGNTFLNKGGSLIGGWTDRGASTERRYIPMDANADGLTDIVEIYKKGSDGKTWAQIRLSDGGSFIRGESSNIGNWSNVNASDARRYLAMDTNGDGLTDIVEIYKKNSSQTGSTIWRNNGSGFDNSNSSSQDLGGWNDRGSSAERRYIPMDVNGDGLDDIVELYKKNENGENKTKALFWQSNGNTFLNKGGSLIGGWTDRGASTERRYIPMDANADGLTDIVEIYKDSSDGKTSAQIRLSDGDGFIRGESSNIGNWSNVNASDARRYLAIDANGDGSPGIIEIYKSGSETKAKTWQNSLSKPDLLTKITTGLGGEMEVNYKPLTDTNVYTKETTITGNQVNIQVPMYVVSQYITKDGRGSNYSFDYQYTGAKIDRQRGWLGFREVKVKDIEGNTEQTITYHQDFPRTGLVTETVQKRVSDEVTLGVSRSGYGFQVQNGVYTIYKEFSETDNYPSVIWEDTACEEGESCEVSGTRLVKYGKDTDWKYKIATDNITCSSAVFGDPGGSDKKCFVSQTTSENRAKIYTLRTEYTYDNTKNKLVMVANLGDYEDGIDNDTSDDVYSCYQYNTGSSSNWWKAYFPTARKIVTDANACNGLNFGDDSWDAKSSETDTTYDLAFQKFSYDSDMNLTEQKVWDDNKSKFIRTSTTYDNYGNVTSKTDPLGNTGNVAYDTTFHTFPVRVDTPPTPGGAPLTITATYEPKFGVETQRTDANGKTVMNIPSDGIDKFGRIIKAESIEPDNNTLTHVMKREFLLEPNGMSVKTWQRKKWGNDGNFESSNTDNKWLWSKTYIDGMGRSYKSEAKGKEDNEPLLSEVIFDSQGRSWKESLPYYSSNKNPQYILREYDIHNRPTKVISPNGAVQEIVYDNLDDRKITQQTPDPTNDSNLVKSYATADSRGRIVSTKTPDGAEVFYEYDKLGRRTKIIDPLAKKNDGDPPDNLAEAINLPDSKKTVFTYNSLGQTLTATKPELGLSTYSYDDAGRMQTVTDAKGQKQDFSYDNLGRVTSKKVYKADQSLESDTTFTYDTATNGKGTVATVNHPEADYHFSYNFQGGLASQVTAIDTDGNGTKDDYSTSYTYDALGRPIDVTYPDNSILRYTYTDEGHLNEIELKEAGGSFTNIATYGDYNSLGQIGSMSYANGVNSNYTYDVLGRMQTSTTQKNALTLHDFSYGWNKANKLLEITDNRLEASPSLTQNFTYDSMGRLTKATALETYGVENYEYDLAGNLNKHNGVKYIYDPVKKHQMIRGCNDIQNDPDCLTSGNDNTSLNDTEHVHMALEYDDNGNIIRKSMPSSGDKDFAHNITLSGEYNQSFTESSYGQAIIKNGTTLPQNQINIKAGNGFSIGNEVSFEKNLDLHTSTNTSTIGNPQSWNYTYDAENRLTSVEREVLTNDETKTLSSTTMNVFTYDGAGRRVSKTDAVGTSEERNTYYVSGLYEVVRDNNGNTQHTKYIHGPNGVISAITKTGTGNVVAWEDYQNKMVAAASIDTGSWGGGLKYMGAKISQFLSYPNISVFAQGMVLAMLAFITAGLGLITVRGAAPESLLGRMRRNFVQSLTSLGIIKPITAKLWSAHKQTGWASRHRWGRKILPLVMIMFLGTFVGGQTALATLEGDGTPVVGQTRYFHTNHLGSSTLITDETGAEVNRLVYEPYGEIDRDKSSGVDTSRPKFTGKEFDVNSDLSYFGARYYDGHLGRFLTPDPAGQFFSPYLYGANDPLTHIDPDGRLAIITAIVVGALIGAAIGAYIGGSVANGSWNPGDWDWSSSKTWKGIVIGAIIGAIIGGAVAAAPAAGLAATKGATISSAAVVIAGVGGGLAGGVLGGEIAGGDPGAILPGSGGNGGGGGSSSGGFNNPDVMAGGGRQTETCPVSQSSFPEDTIIATSEGAKDIEDIEVGDEVWSYNEETESVELKPVSHLFTRIATGLIVLTIGTATVEATPEHPFYVPDKGWVEAKDLAIGDEVFERDGDLSIVTNSAEEAGDVRVYNFEVEGNHNYFVGELWVLVHNPSRVRCTGTVATFGNALGTLPGPFVAMLPAVVANYDHFTYNVQGTTFANHTGTTTAAAGAVNALAFNNLLLNPVVAYYGEYQGISTGNNYRTNIIMNNPSAIYAGFNGTNYDRGHILGQQNGGIGNNTGLHPNIFPQNVEQNRGRSPFGPGAGFTLRGPGTWYNFETNVNRDLTALGAGVAAGNIGQYDVLLFH